jgi:hypothetical protein
LTVVIQWGLGGGGGGAPPTQFTVPPQPSLKTPAVPVHGLIGVQHEPLMHFPEPHDPHETICEHPS